MNLTDQEIATLEACPNSDAWNDACLAIKSARGGHYPPDWYAKVLAPGGISSRLQVKWNDPTAFNLHYVAVK